MPCKFKLARHGGKNMIKKKEKLFGWNIAEPKSKIEQVLAHLVHHRKIDTWTAFTKFGATRLSSIIHNLRVHFNIVSKEIKNKEDGRKNYVSYVFKGTHNHKGETE